MEKCKQFPFIWYYSTIWIWVAE